MWIILISVCVSVIHPNNAQELTSFEAQTATETSYTNSDVIRDSTRPPVTLTIRNGRTDNIDRSITRNSDLPLFYSNQWQPILMPIGFNSNRDPDSHANEHERFVDHQLVPTYLRRPDSEANNSVPYLYQHEFSHIPVPYSPVLYFQSNSNLTADSLTVDSDQMYPEALSDENLSVNAGNFQAFDLYRTNQNFMPPVVSFHSASHSNLNSNDENRDINAESKPISSIAVPKSTNSDPLTSRKSEENNRPVSIKDNNAERVISNPMDFYRDQRFLPPMVPSYFPPYPFLPFQRDGTFPRMVPYSSNVPNFDREAGSEVDDRIQEAPEKEVLTEGASVQRVENLPSETPTNIIPPQSLPLPVGGYPFGLYPQPFVPPFLPPVHPSGFPLPIPQPKSINRENKIVDVSQPPPIITVSAVQDIIPEALPQIGNMAPEDQLSVITNAQVNPEEAVVEEANPTKIPYEFGFDMNDGQGNDQHRKEVSDISGVVTGSYGYRDAFGVYRIVFYTADKSGFHAFIKSNEPGVASSGSADVVVMAERPPPKAIAEGRKEPIPEIIAVRDPNTDLIVSGSIPESI